MLQDALPFILSLSQLPLSLWTHDLSLYWTLVSRSSCGMARNQRTPLSQKPGIVSYKDLGVFFVTVEQDSSLCIMMTGELVFIS
jgi:hypothetical protein